MKISCIIPTRDTSSPQYEKLVESIKNQDYPSYDIEIIGETRGDSEQAKAYAIKKAHGDIFAMFCDDNILLKKDIFQIVSDLFTQFDFLTGVYSENYTCMLEDNMLNRYFSLMGFNDPVPAYFGKADRLPYYKKDANVKMTVLLFKDDVPSLGDNCFFIRKDHLLHADLDHYYPMDVCLDMARKGFGTYVRVHDDWIWHKTTDGNLFNFLTKRYKYAKDLRIKRQDRRWRVINRKKDKLKLVSYIFNSLTLIQPLLISIKGYLKYPDLAWFLHPFVNLSFFIMYSGLWLEFLLRRLLFRL